MLEFIVLGQIPGTHIQLNFMQVLAFILSVGTVVYAQHELRRVHDKQQSAQN